MLSLKNEELTQRKNELIERLREWKSTFSNKNPSGESGLRGGAPKGKSPEKKSVPPLEKENVNVVANTNKKDVDYSEIRKELEESVQKEHAKKIVAVTELIKEKANEDLDKAIYELHAQLFLNSVERQHMEELEEKAAMSIQVLTMKHRREVMEARQEKASYEAHANDVVNQLNSQMESINQLAMKRIEELEKENAALRMKESE